LEEPELGSLQRKGGKPITQTSAVQKSYPPITAPLPQVSKKGNLGFIRRIFHHLQGPGRSSNATDMLKNSKKLQIRSIRALTVEEPSRSSGRHQISR
jgi:hypothetical protein